MTKSILAVCMVFFLTVCCSAAEPEIKAEDLPRIKPTEPADALKTFKVRPGFHIELAASEPQVVDPIAMCFDENGRLFVVEMRDYSERRNEKLGRIRMLEDTDDDGVFDKATVFLDHLPWPTALFWCNGGLLVGATPDIIFAKDTDKDGVADQTQRLFTGFGATQERLNVQGLFNNFIWGLDNRVHGCSGHDGGLVERVAELGISRAPTRERAPGENAPLDVRNRGFVINPSDWSMKTENGGGQYGLSFDPTGRLFTCTNSSHCELFMFDARYASQNPSYAPPDPRISIAADGPAAEVFRISPEEPWRVIRTRWRIAGLVPGPVEGGGRSAGYFTGATGITIYRGNAFGPEYVGDAFIGDAGGNLVHHKRIRTPRGEVQPLAERPADEKKMEFCASNDTWFRAVDFANAPDGCLYIADMYRETIEHPWSIPPNIKKFLDLNSGNDRGRIYRLVPDGYVRPKKPRLGKASTEELVAMLEHPNGWHRETAARLLFERQDQSAVPLLTGSVQHSQSPLARMHALYALDGLSALTESHVVQALADPDSTVRVHAIKLAERFVQDRKISAQLSSHLLALADDPEIAVRYQLAFTLGQIDAADRIEALAKLAQTDGRQRWMQVAVLTAIGEGNAAAALFQRLCDEGAGEMLHSGALQRVIGARHDADEVKRVLSRVMVRGDEGFKLATARGLLEGAEQNNAAAGLRPLFGDVF
ncbi:MAG TPA: PVC-type heme-binding CxxCH protein, partial [Tepidisphaeraceae bacterium]